MSPDLRMARVVIALDQHTCCPIGCLPLSGYSSTFVLEYDELVDGN
eukprot:SAG31_NODE_20271_length_579_cov_0.783333_2_plen_45_part_01